MSLDTRLRQFGLSIQGVIRLEADEVETLGLPAYGPMLALVGNIGSSYWPIFSQSAEYADGNDDPLDRWSRRVAEEIAETFEMTPVYPFEGPPYYPFQRWAARAESLQQSPVGVMMHPRHGLWHSYRFALLGERIVSDWTPSDSNSPCLDCIDKPCLLRCPVGALDENGYAVERCAGYLQETPLAECTCITVK